MTCRQAKERDRSAIYSLLDLSFTAIYAFYAKKTFTSLENTAVMERKKRTVGFISWRVFGEARGKRIGYLFWLAVHPEERRKGTGERLMKRAISEMTRKNGPMDIYGAIEKRNLPSARLLAKLRFVPCEKSLLKKKYGKNYSGLFAQMMLMPWEKLLVRPRGVRAGSLVREQG